MNTTRRINLFSVKGGQGVTTTTVLVARYFASQGNTVLLVDRKDGDLSAMLGLGENGPTMRPISDNMALLISANDTIDSHEYDVVISDMGKVVDGSENYLVTMPDYVSLRRAVANDDLSKFCDGVIVVRPANRVLSDRDVTSVLGLPLISTINMSDAVARASDAGLLASSRTIPNITLDNPVEVMDEV